MRTATSELVEGRCEGTLAERAPRHRRLRLRPGVRPRRHRARGRSHDGRARPGREACDQPPGPRRAKARPGPGVEMVRGTKSRAATHQCGLERAADRPEDRRRRDHGLDRDPHRGRPLGHRPRRVGDRPGLGPQGRRASRPRAPLRPREGREPGGGDRGDADPRRRRDHHLRGDASPGGGRRGRAPGGGPRGDRLLGGREPRRLGLPGPPGSGASIRRRSRATPPTCAPTRSPRSACSSASASS